MSSSNSPCAACKCLRRKCTPECVFAPYFPPDNPQKFANVHKVFGASNVAKILHELNANQCEDAVNSLAYEAEHRMRDPVYGCVGLISILQQRLKQVQHDLDAAKRELATYIGPNSMFSNLGLMQPPSFGPSYTQMIVPANNVQQLTHNAQEQILEAHIAAAREQEMLRSFEQQQKNQDNELGRFIEVGRNNNDPNDVVAMMGLPSLALGSVYHHHENSRIQRQGQVMEEHELQLQLQQSRELLVHQQQNVALNHNHQQPQLAKQQIAMRAKSEEDRGLGQGPTC